MPGPDSSPLFCSGEAESGFCSQRPQLRAQTPAGETDGETGARFSARSHVFLLPSVKRTRTFSSSLCLKTRTSVP